MNSMKLMKIMKLGIIFLGSLLFQISFAHSQTFIISNLGETSIPTTTESRFWASSSFTTGPQAATLNGLVTRLPASQFLGGNRFISIFSNSANLPGIEYATFQDNPDNFESDRFRFTPNGDVELSANTTYWAVFGVRNGNDNDQNDDGDFDFYFTESTNEISTAPGWTMGEAYYNFSDIEPGATWTGGATGAVLFGIEATIVPEPSTYAFASGICLIAFVAFRRIRISKIAKSSI